MEADEPVLISKVTAPGEDAGVASRLEAGMRALALQVDVTSGVSGFLRPGDRVDVYWTGAGRGGRSITRLIRSNVQIIAIDQITDEDRNSPTVARTITVTAAPADIAALTQAQASGNLTLALVGVATKRSRTRSKCRRTSFSAPKKSCRAPRRRSARCAPVAAARSSSRRCPAPTDTRGTCPRPDQAPAPRPKQSNAPMRFDLRVGAFVVERYRRKSQNMPVDNQVRCRMNT
jgi:Flp pilus assembly protein CpaB